MTATEYVVLVDEQDQAIGTAEKLEAHEKNLLHRAFSIFIFRNHPDTQQPLLLLQQRALSKYHSPGLWTNTCCSHPRPNESILDAATRRLQEEFGFQAPLKNIGRFHYNAHFPNGLAENEIDHVLIGSIGPETIIAPNPEEIHAYRWISLEDLQKELAAEPARFTPWLKQAVELIQG